MQPLGAKNLEVDLKNLEIQHKKLEIYYVMDCLNSLDTTMGNNNLLYM